MKKTFTILIAAIAAILMMTQPGKVWGQDPTTTLTASNLGVVSGTSYNNSEKTPTVDGIDYYLNYICSPATGTNAGNMQVQANNGIIYNTSPFDGNIKSVAITHNGTARSTTIWGSTNGTDWVSITSGNGSLNADFITNQAQSYYYFKITRGSNAAYWSQIVITYASSAPTQLSAPTNFSATAGNGQAEFTWEAVSDASSYTISYTPAGGTEQTTTGITGTSTTITGLTNNTTYSCKIKAVGDGTNFSDSEYSDATDVTPTAAQQYNVSIASGITGGTVGANPTTATAGTTINVTVNPNGGYYLSALSYTDGQTTTDIDQTTLQFEMPASNVTINAGFTAYVVTLHAGNGTVAGAQTAAWNVSMNNGNLPNATPPCNAWTFYGWKTTSALGEQTTTAPSCVNGTGYEPTATITLYAVYKKTESGNTNTDSSVTLSNGVFTAATSTDLAYITWTEDFITILQEKGEGNAVAEYVTNPRWYQDNVITLTPNVTVNSIAITQYDSKYGLENANTSVSNGTMSVSNHVATIEPTNGNQDVVITMGAQARISAISVNHVVTTTYYHSTPDCTETVATPTFDVNEGIYYEPQIIIIECETADASIYYTLNGEEPTSTESATNFLYDENEGVEISSTTTLKAKAFKTGMNPSATRTATYTIIHDVAEPTLAESQLFTTDTYSVAITVPANTTVYYTTDGTAPTNASTPYTAAFDISATTTVKAIAYDIDGCASDVVTATFTRAYTLAGAKALYEGSDVTNVTISLNGVQFIAKSGSSTYMQQGTTGLMIYGSHSQDLTNGDVFTAGTVTGTITKYGENLELSISSGAFANVAKTAGTLAASATDVEITDITGDFSTYESRYVALESLEMSVTDKTLSDGTNTLAIYDPFHVLDEAIQPDDDVIVTGVVTSYYKNPNTTYQIIPLAKSGITTGIAATLPTLNPAGGADAAHAVSTETVIVTPATSTTVTYTFGSIAYGEINAETEITVPSTEATELEVVASRDFYTDNSASYYYMSAAASYTVYFYENGTLTYYEDNVVSGTSLAISSTTAPNGYEFMGWTTSEITEVQSGAPATLYNGSVTVEDNMNLYAVYALEGEASVSYNKVDGYSSITEGTYLIAVNKVDSDYYNFANGQAASGHAGVEATGVATATSYTASDIPEGALEYTLAGNNTDGFSIHCSSGYLNATSAKASLSYGNTATETWIFSNKDGGLVLTGANNSSKASCNSATAASAIRNYASSGSYYDPLYFFKKTETPAYSNYCTTITYTTYNDDETRTTPILANEIVTVPNGTVLTLNTTNGGTAANLIIEDGGILITHTDGIQATVEKNITAVGATNWAATSGAQGWYFIASPVDGAAFTTATVDDYDLYMLDWANKYWRNIRNTTNNSLFANGFTRGTGYLYASKDGNTVSVAGEIKPLTAADTAQVVLKTNGWNLIGNPLTCKVTVNKAFSELTNASTVTNSKSGSAINPCQGIAVWGSANDVVTFTKAATQNAAAPSNNSSLQMTLSQNIVTRGNTTSTTVDNAVVSFNEGSVLPKFSMLEGNAKLYIPQGNEEYAIVSTNAQGEMPVNFVANEEGAYTITVNPENVEMNYLHLIDNIAGQDIDLLANPSYTFNGNADDYPSRFRLVFIANDVNQNDNENESFAFIGSDGQLIVNGIGTVQIIDLTGRVISTKSTEERISTNGLTPGVYVLRLIGEKVKTQKIVVR